MKHTILLAGALAVFAAMPAAHAAAYEITQVYFEPDTQPKNTVFKGTFDYDAATKTVSNLQGVLSEAMTGSTTAPGPSGDYGMTWLTLGNQLASWYDAALGGTFAAAFRNTDTHTFTTMTGGDGWSPGTGLGMYYGVPGPNPGNAYALIFVPDDPLVVLTQTQIDKLAYADCAPGGMMGATCMTGTSIAGYGMIGTMSGYPLSQTITAVAAVPEPETWGMLLAGLGLVGFAARTRRKR